MQIATLQQQLAAHEHVERQLKEEYQSRVTQLSERADRAASREATLEDRVEELEAALSDARGSAAIVSGQLERLEQKSGRLEDERCASRE